MSYHTPGPWDYKAEGDDAFKVFSEDYGGIALLHDPVALSMGDMDRLENDARLIAAAPDLLEACIQARAALPDPTFAETEEQFAVIELLTSAIDKAHKGDTTC